MMTMSPVCTLLIISLCFSLTLTYIVMLKKNTIALSVISYGNICIVVTEIVERLEGSSQFYH